MTDEATVIIGAGPAGLTAGLELVRRGVRPIIIEKSDKVGGISRTESYKGYHFDIGGHRFFTKVGMIDKLWKEMLDEDFLKVQRTSRIYYKGRYFRYPLAFFDALSKLGVSESARILLSYIKMQCRPYRDEKTFEQWVANRFGWRLYEIFFRTYTEKVWGIPCDTIQADWAAQRIKGMSLVAAVSNALFGTRNAKTLIGDFHYPLKGPGMMWERFHEAFEAGNGTLLLNTDAVNIKHSEGRVHAVSCTRNDEKIEIPVRHLISSIPITELVTRLDPRAPDDVVEACRRLSYRDFVVVGLIVNKGDLFSDQWIYIHSSNVKVGRIQNFKNWSAAMVPDTGKTSIGMEYFCNEGDEIWRMPDTELIELATAELAELGLSETGDVIDGVVLRQPKAYPVYDQEYHRHLTVIRNFLKTIENAQTIGRNGMHRYNNMDHSMLTGLLASRNVLGENHDLWEVNEDEIYLEEDKEVPVGRAASEIILKRAFATMDKLALAIAAGSVSGLFFFLLTMWTVLSGGPVGEPNLSLLAQYFAGYTVTVSGAFVAFGYSFFWGFLFGWLFAYLRNFIFAFYVFRVRKRAELSSLKNFFDYL